MRFPFFAAGYAALLAICFAMAFCFAAPANAQRVFRASAVDIEQDERIDGIDARIERIEATVDLLATAVAAQAEKKPEPVQPVTAPPAAVKPEPAPAKIETVVAIQKPTKLGTHTTIQPTPGSHYSQAELIGIVQGAYPDGNFTKYANVSPQSAVWRHLQDTNHRFTATQVNGLPQNIALGLHGLHHKNLIRPERNTARTSAPIAKAQPASVPQQTFTSQPVYQSSSGCANGQCARQSPQVRSTRFRLFQRR